VLRNAIENADTLNVIKEIMNEYRRVHKKDKEYEPGWAGIDLGIDSKQLQALLGTLNGHGVAWLLIQHKAEKLLGHKTVGKATLFFTTNAERGNQPSLLFHLKDIV
jgi:hypothetical protein